LEILQATLRAASACTASLSAEAAAPLAATLDGLQQVIEDLEQPLVTVAFSGHFSSGKSTLINGLLGQAFLPTGYLPETGVPCYIRAGEEAGAVAVLETGNIPLPVDPRLIAEYVSLIDQDGSYRELPGKVQRLTITVPSTQVPRHVELVDSPGINDTKAMTEKVGVICEAADIVVWVVNSKQPFSEVETAFLQSLLSRAALHKLVFVVNAFLATDGIEDWQAYLNKQASFVERRIERSLCLENVRYGSAIVHVSARGLSYAPNSFGDPELRRMMAAVIDPSGHYLDESRSARALAAAHRFATDLQGALEFLRGGLMIARQAAAKNRQELLQKAAESAVGKEFGDARIAVAESLAPKTIVPLGLGQKTDYAQIVHSAIEGVVGIMAERLAWRLRACAQRYGYELDRAAAEEIRRVLQPTALDVVLTPGKSASEIGLEVTMAARRLGRAVVNRDPGTKAVEVLSSGWTIERKRLLALSSNRDANRARVTVAAQTAWQEVEGRQADVVRLGVGDLVKVSEPRGSSADAAAKALADLTRVIAELNSQLRQAESMLERSAGSGDLNSSRCGRGWPAASAAISDAG
jgi:predicted GTPase